MASVCLQSDNESTCRTTWVEVKNLRADVREEYIKEFFEDEEVIGQNIQVKFVHIDQTTRSALIEVIHNSDEFDFLYNQTFDMDGVSVTAEKFSLSTIEVSGSPGVVCETYKNHLMRYFKSEVKSCGGPIQDITIIQPGICRIRYCSEEDSRKVVQRKNHKLMNEDLVVHLYHPKNYKSKTLKLTNLPDNIHKEHLEFLFEDEDEFETPIQVEIDLHEDQKMAFVHCCDVDDVELILQKSPLKINGQTVKVERWSCPKETAKASSNCIVEVKGPPAIISNENEPHLKRYFKTEHRSGGGNIVDFKIESGTAYITYETEEVARRVATRPNHVVLSTQLQATLFDESIQEKMTDNENTICTSKNKVEVLGLRTSVSADFLELLFEKEGGSEVLDVTINEDKSSAIILFDNEEAVEKVLNKQTITKGQVKLSVRRYESSGTIEVTCHENIQDKIEFLELYFNHEKRSGGCDVVEHFADTAENVAYFKFRSREVAQRVAKRDHSKQHIKVKLLREGTSISDIRKKVLAKSATEVTNLSNTSSVRVTGIPTDASMEKIRLYFENTIRSGGGKVVDIIDDIEDSSIRYITFENQDVARSVSQRQHRIDENELEVMLYIFPPYEETKILVKGIHKQTTRDSLTNFLEAKTNISIISICGHAREQGVAMVTFKSKPDFNRLKKACAKTSLEGANLKVFNVPFTNCILVRNLPVDVSEETVSLYFESKKAGRNSVDKVSFTDSRDSCLVYFNDYKDVDKVLQLCHQLYGQQLVLKKYEHGIGSPENEPPLQEMTDRIPEPIENIVVEKYKMKFLNKSNFRNTVEQEMLHNGVKIIWPSREEEYTVKFECIISKQDKNAFELLLGWKERSVETFHDILKKISVIEVPVSKEILSKALQFLEKISISRPDDVAVITCKNEEKLVIVGQTVQAETLHREIKSNLSKLEAPQNEGHVMKKISPIELKLLQKLAYPEKLKIKFQDINAEIDLQENYFILEGGSIHKAALDIYEKIKEFSTESISKSDISIALYHNPETQKFIEEKLESFPTLAVWMIEKQNIVICCSDKRFQKQCITVIAESVVEKEVDISGSKIPVLKTESWSTKCNDIRCANENKVNISLKSDDNKIIVCATDDIIERVHIEIQDYIKNNVVVTDNVHCDPDVLMLLEYHHGEYLREISKGHEDEHITILIDRNTDCIKIQCLENGLKYAQAKIKQLLHDVRNQPYTVTKPGIVDFMRTREGKASIAAIEKTQPCRITVEMKGKVQCQEIAKCGFNKRKIFAVVADITDLDVQLIVNPSGEDMSELGTLGRKVIEKGGPSIKDARTKKGSLKDCEVFISDGGSLKAIHIAHIRSVDWFGGSTSAFEKMAKTVTNCLRRASELQVNSLAIPAIGSGVNSFPAEHSCKVIVNTLRKFLLEQQDSSISEIYLCDMDRSRVTHFSNAMCLEFGRQHVQISSDDGTPTPNCTPIPQMQPQTTGVLLDQTSSAKHIKTTVVRGEIAKQQVDVIVNTTSMDLQLTKGAVSISLLKAAGRDMQDEIDKNYPRGLSGNNVAITKGYKLKCAIVLHTSLHPFDNRNPVQSRKNLRDVVISCLSEANKLGYLTVAFPAIGTGSLGYRGDVVAEEMITAISIYENQNPQSSITEVTFVVYPGDKDIAQDFELEHGRNLLKKKSSVARSSQSAAISGSSSSGYPCVFRVKNIPVTLKQGDILQEQQLDCIVIGINKSFDLKSGALSSGLLAQCGKSLELEFDKSKEEMIAKKIGYTSAPRLPFRVLIFVYRELPDLVEKGLKLAESLQMQSVGFPTINNASEYSMRVERAKDFAKSLKSFAKSKPTFVRDVRLVIFDAGLYGIYQSAFEKVVSKKYQNKFENVDSAITPKKKEEAVTFNIYSLSDDVISYVKYKINNCLDEVMTTDELQANVIERLENNQIFELKSISRKHQVHMDIDKEKGKIMVTGIKENVKNVKAEMNSFIRDATEMELMTHVVQWHVLPETEKTRPYDKEHNIRIERAFQKHEKTVQIFKSGEKQNYVIDFNRMVEYPKSDPSTVSKVIRRDLEKSGYRCETPITWESMSGDLIVVVLDSSDQEYLSVLNVFLRSCAPHKLTVIKIERIQNKTLYEQYQSKKKSIGAINQQQNNESLLWHGTAPETVASINVHGFNRSYCGRNATRFGEGVYFAVNAKYSLNTTYSKPDSLGIQRIYYCRVLTGEFTQGKEGMRVPPPNPARGPQGLFNSVVDDMDEKKRNMFVIFHDTQAYPEYLIHFKRLD